MNRSNRMTLTTLTAAFAATLLFSQSVQARVQHRHWRVAHHNAGSRDFGTQSESRGYGARPSAWCGWEMRHLVGSDPGEAFNLARNWAHWGHPGPAGVGAVVVWPHHVGTIVGHVGGVWVIESGN